MKIVSTTILVALILLAMLSGITKVALMQQDVDFFGRYGFSNPLLIAYGLVQLIGAVLMVFRRTRFIGAAIVAITFLVSLAALMIDRNFPASIATIVATLLLGVPMKQSWKPAASEP